MRIIAFILAGLCFLGVCQVCYHCWKRRQGSRQYRRPNVVDSLSAIRKILTRSIVERSNYELDFESDGQPLALKGVPMECGANGTLLVDLSHYRSVRTDLISKTCTVYFRIGSGDRQEFFYFHTSTRGLENRKSGLNRHQFLHLEAPTQLKRGQRRRHFRLQPSGEAQVKVNLGFQSDGKRETTLFTNTPAEDISAGGLRVILDDQPNLQCLSCGTTVILTVKLRPCYFEVERAGVPDTIRFRSVILENAVTHRGRRVLRFQFLAREILKPGYTRPHFNEDLARINEDITRWIHACQRNSIRRRLEPPNLARISSRRQGLSASPPPPARFQL